jgi:hypothetical protein
MNRLDFENENKERKENGRYISSNNFASQCISVKANKFMYTVMQVPSGGNVLVLSDRYDDKIVLTFKRNVLPPHSE